MSKELSNREQKFRDEYMDILHQAIRKDHPPGKYFLLDKVVQILKMIRK